VTEASQIKPAILRGIEQTRNGTPALLEFITGKETAVSRHPPRG
jgi:acetolactate synthase-1/2/3 large subunit